MKMEKRIVDLDIAIRSALHHEEPDMTRSISLISELQQLAIQPLMLKKIPNIVMTLRKVRKYIGPVTAHPDPKVHTEISSTTGLVRILILRVLMKFFHIPNNFFLQYIK